VTVGCGRLILNQIVNTVTFVREKASFVGETIPYVFNPILEVITAIDEFFTFVNPISKAFFSLFAWIDDVFDIADIKTSNVAWFFNSFDA